VGLVRDDVRPVHPVHALLPRRIAPWIMSCVQRSLLLVLREVRELIHKLTLVDTRRVEKLTLVAHLRGGCCVVVGCDVNGCLHSGMPTSAWELCCWMDGRT
jgi:hypothetical protein